MRDPWPLPNEVDMRFWDKADVGDDGCWEWRGCRGSNGYGRFATKPQRVHNAHHVAYLLCVGPVPDGFHVDHLCRNRGCVRPAHLEAVPAGVNTLRGESPWARRARQTHCLRGHPFDEENTYVQQKRGTRSCRRCAQEREQRRVRDRSAYNARRRERRRPMIHPNWLDPRRAAIYLDPDWRRSWYDFLRRGRTTAAERDAERDRLWREVVARRPA